MRIITESARAPRLVDDHAIGPAFHDGQHLPGFRQSNHANVMGGPMGHFIGSACDGRPGVPQGFDLVKVRQQSLVILRVGSLGAGEARGVDSGRAIERV